MSFPSHADWQHWKLTKSEPVNVTKDKIESFRSLEAGWNYGEGLSIDPEIISMAIDLNQYALNKGFWETDAFPGPDGSLRVTVYEEKDYLEFTIKADKKVTFIHEIGEEEKDSAELTIDNSKIKISDLSDLRDQKWNSFDSYTPSTLISEEEGSKAMFSATSTAEYPQLALNV